MKVLVTFKGSVGTRMANGQLVNFEGGKEVEVEMDDIRHLDAGLYETRPMKPAASKPRKAATRKAKAK